MKVPLQKIFPHGTLGDFGDYRYRLTVTDPKIEREYLKKINGTYLLQSKNVYMCVSIGEPYEGYCYKLVAAILTAA